MIVKLGFSGILHSTMVELLFKTFKCGRVDLLSHQKETFFRKQKRICDTVNTLSSLLKQLYLATSYTQQLRV